VVCALHANANSKTATTGPVINRLIMNVVPLPLF